MDESGQLDPSADPLLQQVLTDYSRRIAAGEPITQAELISQNPAVADALRSHFSVVEDVKQASAPDATSSDPITEYVRHANRTTIPPRPTASTSTSLPAQFGRYRIGRCLGQGAMGAVYLADDTQLDRQVALKIPKFIDASDSELIERFDREARAAATLRHPNLCPVYDAGHIDGIQYLSMAYIEGRSLSDVLAQDGPPAPRDAAILLLKLAKGVAAAHAAGVIHRDLKPANILIDAHREPIIMDFGLARRMNKEDSRLTQSGLLMGSPAYMSPEQVEGNSEKMGPACDIYSLGIIFYELLTGEVPFRGSIAAVMGQIITATPKKPSVIRRDVDASLETICLAMIAKTPLDRFASMQDVVGALESYLAGLPTGIAIPKQLSAVSEPQAGVPGKHSPGGIVIAPWMLITAVAVVIGGFGVTWHLIATMMRQQPGDEIRLDAPMQEKLASGAAKVWLDNKALSDEELERPLVLAGGKHVIELREGSAKGTPRTIESDPEDPTILEKTQDDITFKSRQHRVAEWVLSHGGKVKVAGVNEPVASADMLPKGQLRISEIDLTDVTSIPRNELEAIKTFTSSLQRLLLPKTGIKLEQIRELRQALPNCTIVPES